MSRNVTSPFHAGEREIQERLGVREQVESIGRRFIRDHMPDEHRQFYAQLPWLLVGSIDGFGRPWASVLAGRPGFLSSPDAHSLIVKAQPAFGDPLSENLAAGAPVGLLGIELSTRRRNRVNGVVSGRGEEGFKVAVGQTFGNCPQYIQARDFKLLPGIDRVAEPRPVQTIRRLDDRARKIVSNADTLFIATNFAGEANGRSNGSDVSHRGGKPGFVRVDSESTLTLPDFSGNRHFNTLGNILLDPRAGLLFVDFDNGDLLSLTGSAEIVWDGEEVRAFSGAERFVRLTLDEGVLIERAVPIRWRFVAQSPSLANTGSWDDVRSRLEPQDSAAAYREYSVTRVEKESDVISSFYLEPADASPVPLHRPGQFLPLEIQPPGAESPVRRTYTISNAPNGRWLRLSIKREPPARADLPPGISSNYFHEHISVGSSIRALLPRGKFTLSDSGHRSVVMLSAGVGVTPMISMLQHLAESSGGCGAARQVWFIHGATSGSTHAFGRTVRELAAANPCINVHIRYSRPSENDVEVKDYDSIGYVDIELLRSLLPFDDYEFYLCGPRAFMESLHTDLKALNVPDDRIHYEFFGAGSTLMLGQPEKAVSSAKLLADANPVTVRFARSGTAATWVPSAGSLLDLAESRGLRPAYSCRSGVCQTCETAVLAGETAYLEPPLATPGEGRVLLCCAYPRRSDTVGEVVLDA